MSLVSTHDQHNLYTSPPRVTQSSTFPDVILTSNTALVFESGIIENQMSDNDLIFTILIKTEITNIETSICVHQEL